MKKSKKVILVIISILSCLIIASVPCFASNELPDKRVNLSDYNFLNPTISFPSVLRMYTMGFDTNKNMYDYPYLNDSFEFKNLNPGTNPRLGLLFLFNNNVIGPRDGWIFPHSSNTYSSYSVGFYSIEFNLYVAPSGEGNLRPVYDNDISLNGFRSNRSSPTFYDSDYDDLIAHVPYSPNSDEIFQSYSSKIHHSQIDFVNHITFATDTISRTWRQYKVRLIVPAFEGLYTFDMSFKFPEYYNDTQWFFNYDVRVRNIHMVYAEDSSDIEDFFYIPEFDKNFEGIEDTEEFFDDNLSDSLDDFKNIGDDMLSFLDNDGGLLSAFAVWNTYIGDIFDLKPIRILLTFSIIIGLFTFVVSASNLFVGVSSSHRQNKNNRKR